MANRDALRDLQSRLAERLAAARTEPRSAAWLAVDCAGQGVLVALPSAGEIFAVGPLLPVPHTRDWFVGVANLRGLLHGVVDLAAFLGLRPALPAADAARDGARLLALNASLGSHCALLIDRLAGLRSAEQMTRDGDGAATHHNTAGPSFAGPRWRDADGRIWQEIDLQALAAHEVFLAIAA